MGFYEMIFYFLFIFYKFINEGGGGGVGKKHSSRLNERWNMKN